MTPDEFHDKMVEIRGDDRYDAEGSHKAVDALMMKLLRELGFDRGVDVFDKMDKWYT